MENIIGIAAAIIVVALATGAFKIFANVSLDFIKLFLRIALAVILGLVLCYACSSFGATACIVGLIGGLLIGFLLPLAIFWAFKQLKWWAVLLVVVTLIAAFIAAIL